jgi:methyltransferase (TIGR00027 family)
MQQNAASKTAEYMALFRAIEMARGGARLFEDRWARRFLRPRLRGVATLARAPLLGRLVPWFIDRRWPGARSSAVARTRFIDDALGRALTGGIDQIVVLGAGYDCRAYRLPGIERARIFEVDHPDTSAAKRRAIAARLGSPPAHVRYTAVDFDRGSLEAAMSAAGLDLRRRVFFLWEGVTNYLTEPAIDATMRYMAQAAAGSQVLFTYVHSDALNGAATFGDMTQLQATLHRAGEPWTFGFDPAELPRYLAARGLRLAADVGSVEYRARYMGAHGAHLRGYAFYRIAEAEIVGAAGG